MNFLVHLLSHSYKNAVAVRGGMDVVQFECDSPGAKHPGRGFESVEQRAYVKMNPYFFDKYVCVFF